MTYSFQRPSKEVHLDLILTRINGLKSDGHGNIKADHTQNYYQPDLTYGHIPDISSTKNGILFLTEAETEETINTTETAEQWASFAQYTAKVGGEFHVVVPESCLEEAKNFAQQEDIRVDHWYYNPNY